MSDTPTTDLESMSVAELVDEHNRLDAERQAINEQMIAVDEVRARKEFEEDQAAGPARLAEAGQSPSTPSIEEQTTVDPTTGKDLGQTLAAAGAESGESVGPE